MSATLFSSRASVSHPCGAAGTVGFSERQSLNGCIRRKKGIPCAVVRYCSRTAGRYQLLPCVEATANVALKNLFEYNLEFHRKRYEEFKAFEDSGEPVCWDNDTALFVNHGIF